MGSWFDGLEATVLRQVENGYVVSGTWPLRRYMVKRPRKRRSPSAYGRPGGCYFQLYSSR
jgi:hypothetical protein